jgi:hypothetical protein
MCKHVSRQYFTGRSRAELPTVSYLEKQTRIYDLIIPAVQLIHKHQLQEDKSSLQYKNLVLVVQKKKKNFVDTPLYSDITKGIRTKQR